MRLKRANLSCLIFLWNPLSGQGLRALRNFLRKVVLEGEPIIERMIGRRPLADEEKRIKCGGVIKLRRLCAHNRDQNSGSQSVKPEPLAVDLPIRVNLKLLTRRKIIEYAAKQAAFKRCNCLNIKGENQNSISRRARLAASHQKNLNKIVAPLCVHEKKAVNRLVASA